MYSIQLTTMLLPAIAYNLELEMNCCPFSFLVFSNLSIFSSSTSIRRKHSLGVSFLILNHLPTYSFGSFNFTATSSVINLPLSLLLVSISTLSLVTVDIVFETPSLCGNHSRMSCRLRFISCLSYCFRTDFPK